MNKINILGRALKLTTTEKLMLDSVKEFVNVELKPHIKKSNPQKIFKQFGEMGLLGPTIHGYNCLGTTNKMYGLIAKEIEYLDSGFRSMYSVQSSLVMNPIHKYGDTRLKEKYLTKLNSGENIGCFGLTEPDSGSDASTMKTRALDDGDYYILNGCKTWITNSPIANVFVVWAKLNGEVRGFVLDRSMPGIETPRIKDKMSLKLSTTGMIFLTDVKVPKKNMLNIKGMKGPFSCLNSARLGISFGVLGAAESCLETAIDYALNRNLFNSLLAEKQIFQYKLANAVSEYNIGLITALNVADMIDSNDYIPEMISLVKRNNCSKALDIARVTRDMLGGNGISREYPIFRHLINLETVNTYEGTHDIHSLILGNYLTDKKAF